MAYQQKKINKHLRKYTGTKKTRVSFNRRRSKNKHISHYDYDDLMDDGDPRTELCPDRHELCAACLHEIYGRPVPSKLHDLTLRF